MQGVLDKRGNKGHEEFKITKKRKLRAKRGARFEKCRHRRRRSNVMEELNPSHSSFAPFNLGTECFTCVYRWERVCVKVFERN